MCLLCTTLASSFICPFLLPVLLPGSWLGIRVTSVTAAGLTDKWTRSGRWASPKPMAWCFLRRPPRTRRAHVRALDCVIGRCRISRTRWRTSLLLLEPNWRDRRNLQWQTIPARHSSSRTRKDRRKSCGPAAEREGGGTFQMEECDFRVFAWLTQNFNIYGLKYVKYASMNCFVYFWFYCLIVAK